MSLRGIARELGIHRNTVRKYLDADGSPAYKLLQPRRTILDPFMDYMQSRWNEGCRNGRQLFIELRERGYRGCYTQVRDAVPGDRSELSARPGQKRQPSTGWCYAPITS
jgi:transposase